MASRERDYRAEYQRRLKLGRDKGLSKAQARRGAKKYARTQPREHIQRERTAQERYGVSSREVTRERMARRQVKGVGRSRMNLQRFHNLNRAMDFASTLPGRAGVYIVGHGTFRVSTKYQGKLRGWAALNDFWAPHRYIRPANRTELHNKDAEIFDPYATTYEVRWSEE